MMRRRDAGNQSILASKMTAVHADIAHAGFCVLGNKRRGHANAAAKARLFDRRGQTRDPELFQSLTGVNDFLNRRAGDLARLEWLGERLAPFFINLRRISTAQSQGRDLARRTVHSRGNTNVMASTAAIDNIFK